MAQVVIKGKKEKTKLAFDEIREELIQVQEENGNFNDAMCDVCFIRTLSSVGVNIAMYLCYLCNKYLCQDCLTYKGHESHRVIKKSEKEKLKKCLRDEMMNESKSEREEMLNKEEVSIVDRVNVQHELDENDEYRITGLCGLNDTRWVVCDSNNNCIKIFSIGSHILQRYLRFGSDPFDVTEIKIKRDIKVKQLNPLKRLRNAITTFLSVKREPTEQVETTTSDMSVINLVEPDKQCLLAVTLPSKRRILLINLTQIPAVVTKSIKTGYSGFSIEFSEDKIFTLLLHNEIDIHVFSGEVYGPWYITVMSTDGVTLRTVDAEVNHFCENINLAVCSERIYITDWVNDKVFCWNDLSQKTIKGSLPKGISVDSDTNRVYICSRNHDKLYRLDGGLESLEPLLGLGSADSELPNALCFYSDRLYVGHGRWSTHVTVIRVI